MGMGMFRTEPTLPPTPRHLRRYISVPTNRQIQRHTILSAGPIRNCLAQRTSALSALGVDS